MYAFTGDPMYKEKAQHVADKLLPAFQTPTGIPNALVNVRTGVSTQKIYNLTDHFGTILFMTFNCCLYHPSTETV